MVAATPYPALIRRSSGASLSPGDEGACARLGGDNPLSRRVVAKPVEFRHSPATVNRSFGAVGSFGAMSPVADPAVHARTFERKVGRTVHSTG
jgi:hypothetical protein